MQKWWKFMLIIQSIFLLILALIVLINSGFLSDKKTYAPSYGEFFLSKNVYSGESRPQSFLPINYAPLKEHFKNDIVSNEFNLSMYLQDLESGASMGIDEYKRFDVASLNKIMLTMILLKQVEKGQLNLDQPIELHRDAGYGDLYKSSLTKLPLKVLIEEMLQKSDNTAFYSVVPLVDKEIAELILDYLDLNGKETEDSQDQNRYLLSPRSMYNVYQSLYYSTILQPENSEWVLHLLANNSYDVRKKASLPLSMTIAHKPGSIYTDGKKEFRDCGIMYYHETRLFYCVMLQGLPEKDSMDLTATIVRDIFDYYNDRDASIKLYQSLCEPNCRRPTFDETNKFPTEK
jgi:beta-lactamase class A